MSNKIISIIGGYGATGKVVVRKLTSETESVVNIVGRNLMNAEKLAGEIGQNSRAVHADIFNQEQLNRLCCMSDIIVNCAGPSVRIKEILAKAAIRENCNYVDVGGYEFTYNLLKTENKYLVEKNLCCVLSAGWIPGIAEVLACYADAIADRIFDVKENMGICYGDRNTWTDSGLLDTIQYIKNNSVSNMAIVKSGKMKKQMNLGFTKTFHLPFNIGKQRGFLHLIPELIPFALSHKEYKEIKSYLVLFGWQTFAAMMKIKFLHSSEIKCIDELKKAYQKEVDTKGKLGISLAEVTGQKNGKIKKLQTGIISNGGYDLTGFGCAATVILLLNKKIKPGVNYLPEAANAEEFMAILNNWGVKISENIM